MITGSGAPRAISWRLDGPLQGEAGVGPAGGGQYCRTKLMVAMLGALTAVLGCMPYVPCSELGTHYYGYCYARC